jgi:hypothetical protein
MTNAQALDLIMKRLGGRSSTTLRATLLLELNNKIAELERGPVKPWFLETEQTQATTPFVVNQNYIALPADFLLEIEDADFRVQDSNGKYNPLVKTSYRRLLQETENVDAGLVEGYALFGNRIYLGPKPDIAYSYKFPYLAKSAAIADDSNAITNSWLLEFFNYITLEAAYVMASEHVQSADLMQKLAGPLQAARRAFVQEVEARIHTNRTYLETDQET